MLTITNVATEADNGTMFGILTQITPALPLAVGMLGAIIVGTQISLHLRRGDEAGTNRFIYTGLVLSIVIAVAASIPTIVENSPSWSAELSWVSHIPIHPLLLGVLVALLIIGALLVINAALNTLARWITAALFRSSDSPVRPRRPRAPKKQRAIVALQTSRSGDYAVVQGRSGRFDVHHYPTGTMLSDASGARGGWSTLSEASEVMRVAEDAGALDTVAPAQTRGALRAKLHELLPQPTAR